jgi:2-dehydro-3-deoxyphosphooctonate aldolase (KDO 8-P synthase)
MNVRKNMHNKTIVLENGQCIGNHLPLALIAGPCVMETESQVLDLAKALWEMARSLGIVFIFKASFDKANRSSISAHRGLGLEQGLELFQEIKARFGCPVLTDVHEPYQCQKVAEVVDVLQIPALLCRQTDLVLEAARTGRILHIKKGQFLAPQDMQNVIDKAYSVGNEQIMACERGVSFGYQNLVNDMRSLPVMANKGCPVTFDGTHSVQKPGALGDKTGGERIFVETLARAAVAVGVAAVFFETHRNPDEALSDGPNMVPFQYMTSFMKTLQEIDTISKQHPYEDFSYQRMA